MGSRDWVVCSFGHLAAIRLMPNANALSPNAEGLEIRRNGKRSRNSIGIATEFDVLVCTYTAQSMIQSQCENGQICTTRANSLFLSTKIYNNSLFVIDSACMRAPVCSRFVVYAVVDMGKTAVLLATIKAIQRNCSGEWREKKVVLGNAIGILTVLLRDIALIKIK